MTKVNLSINFMITALSIQTHSENRFGKNLRQFVLGGNVA
jgi:hypothetical protein